MERSEYRVVRAYIASEMVISDNGDATIDRYSVRWTSVKYNLGYWLTFSADPRGNNGVNGRTQGTTPMRDLWNGERVCSGVDRFPEHDVAFRDLPRAVRREVVTQFKIEADRWAEKEDYRKLVDARRTMGLIPMPKTGGIARMGG